jgi:hypothetical protein
LTAGTQLPGGVAGGRVVEAVDPLEAVKAKHALELDAILGALGRSKAEAAGLREEVGALKKELKDCQGDRDVLRERVGALEARIRELEGSASAALGKMVQPSQVGECWRALLQVIVCSADDREHDPRTICISDVLPPAGAGSAGPVARDGRIATPLGTLLAG